MSTFNPMLAAEGELGKIKYPIVGLYKHNGVRGCNQDGKLVARSLKPIPNIYTRNLYSLHMLDGMEGELVVGAWNDEEVFAISTSGVMSHDGQPDVVWWLFDVFHPTLPFIERIKSLHGQIELYQNQAGLGHRLQAIEYCLLYSDAEVQAFADKALAMGYEGVVLRDPNAPYKQGRSTQREQGLMRFCPWLHEEAKILAIHEGLVNLNESKRNERGYLEKSSHKDNKVGSGRAGSVTCQDVKTGITFDMAVPTVKLQTEMWACKENFLNKIVRYKSKPAVIKGGKPRFPQWEGLRSPLDM